MKIYKKWFLVDINDKENPNSFYYLCPVWRRYFGCATASAVLSPNANMDCDSWRSLQSGNCFRLRPLAQSGVGRWSHSDYRSAKKTSMFALGRKGNKVRSTVSDKHSYAVRLSSQRFAALRSAGLTSKIYIMKTEEYFNEGTPFESMKPALSKAAVIGSAVVWNAPENSDASRVLSQHAFVLKQRGKWYEEKYEGNESLCGRIGIANESERYIRVSEIDSEIFDEKKACKQCVRIARKRHYL